MKPHLLNFEAALTAPVYKTAFRTWFGIAENQLLSHVHRDFLAKLEFFQARVARDFNAAIFRRNFVFLWHMAPSLD